MEQNETYKQYQKQLNELIKLRDEKMGNVNIPDFNSYAEWLRTMEPEQSQISELSGKMKLIQIPEFDEIPDYGDVMTLDDFIENCAVGNFIDYDGFGYYATEDKMTDIRIYPSDTTEGVYRKDFPATCEWNVE